jgi:hypothetical protein
MIARPVQLADLFVGVGSAGTYLGIAAPVGFSGNFAQYQVNGVTAYQVNAAGRVGVGGADISSGLYDFRSVRAAAGLQLFSLENSDTASQVVAALTAGGVASQINSNSSGTAGTVLSNLPSSTALVSTGTGGILIVSRSGEIILATGSSALANKRWKVDISGNLLPYSTAYALGNSGSPIGTAYINTLTVGSQLWLAGFLAASGGGFSLLGNVVGKYPIYDGSGVLKGYLPVYDSIE